MTMLHQLFSENAIQALGWAVVHSLWQGTLAGFFLVICLFFLRNRPASVRYWVANGTLATVLLAAIATFCWYYQPPGDDVVRSVIVLRQGNFGSPLPTVQLNVLQQFVRYFDEHLPLIVTAWLLGVVFFSLRLLAGLAYVQRLRQYQTRTMDAEWVARMHVLASRIPLRSTVGLLESALVRVPMVVGWLKPVILLPAGAINQLTPAQVEAILAHELAHIARHDYLVNILQSAIELLFYYHPAVWWISAIIRAERENCCDDRAVAVCGSRILYAKALLGLQEMRMAQAPPALAMAFAGKPKGLFLNRIKRILNQPQNKSNMMERFTATCLMLALIIALSVSATNPQNNGQANEQPDNATYTANDIAASQDSVPGKGKKTRIETIIKEEDGKKYELRLENGEVKSLTIDGKAVKQGDLEKYEDMIAAMREGDEDADFFNMALPPPAPPAPPAPGDFPAPPAPPAIPKRFSQMRFERLGMDSDDITRIEIVKDSIMRIYSKKGDTSIVIPRADMGNPFYYRFGDGKNNLRQFRYDWDQKAFEKDMEKFNIDMEAFGRDMERWGQEYGKQMEKWGKEFGEKYGREFGEKFGRDMERLADELARETEKSLDGTRLNQLDQHLAEMENLRGLATPPYTVYGMPGAKRSLSRTIESELLKDGFIEPGKKYKFELSGKKLKINGSKQPENIWRKYKKLYEDATGSELNEDSQILLEDYSKSEKGAGKRMGAVQPKVMAPVRIRM